MDLMYLRRKLRPSPHHAHVENFCKWIVLQMMMVLDGLKPQSRELIPEFVPDFANYLKRRMKQLQYASWWTMVGQRNC